MKYQLIKKHTNEFSNPIRLSKGDRFIIGEKSDEHENWNDWYFCKTKDSMQGWVPKQIIRWRNANEGEALEDYSAQEMSANVGEIVIGTSHCNGWIWCTHPLSHEEGWIPAENLVQL